VSGTPEIRVSDDLSSQPRPETASEGDRPKSPWTPSYSVHVLQDNAQESEELDQLDQLPQAITAKQPPVETVSEDTASDARVEDNVTPLPATPEIRVGSEQSEVASDRRAEPERPKSPWTPSYTVTTLQGDSAEKEDEVTEQPAAPRTPEIRISGEPSSEPQPDITNESDRPKSPWTPSYSVHVLKDNAQEAEELDQLDQLPEAVTAKQPPVETVSEDTAPDACVEDGVAPLPVTPDIRIGGEQSEVTGDGTPELERPKSPWTPSYSVTTLQGEPPSNETVPGRNNNISTDDEPTVDIPSATATPEIRVNAAVLEVSPASLIG
jgi:hypothetical protein